MEGFPRVCFGHKVKEATSGMFMLGPTEKTTGQGRLIYIFINIVSLYNLHTVKCQVYFFNGNGLFFI